jgi:HD-GYP domain-containing protein (c-di-GMP phosphodiesterase class II)
MNLIPIDVDTIQVGRRLPFSLRSSQGALLAQKGFLVESKEYLISMVGSGVELFVDVTESDAQRRAYVGKLYELVQEDKPLGKIAVMNLTSDDLALNQAVGDDTPDWLDIQVQANAILRDHNPEHFTARLDRLQAQVNRYAKRNPDGTLFALIHLSCTELTLYSATHALLVGVMCSLAAREVLNWSPELEATLCKAALSMNIGMMDLQDRLAAQPEAPTMTQRQQIDQHVAASLNQLKQLGVTDVTWLDAVRGHHSRGPGTLASMTQGQRMARLIRRADTFAARLAPRATRSPNSPAAAMQAIYFDEDRQIDEAGAALIKAVGVYQPGSFVRLTNNEIAVVVRRGANTTTPRVAVLVNREGMPTGEHVIRDTSLREYRIVASVPHRDVKIQINLERFMPLTSGANDRPW